MDDSAIDSASRFDTGLKRTFFELRIGEPVILKEPVLDRVEAPFDFLETHITLILVEFYRLLYFLLLVK